MNCNVYLIHIMILFFMKGFHQQVHAAQNVFLGTSTKGREGSELTTRRESKVTEQGSTIDRTSEAGGLRIHTESYRDLDKGIQENYQTGFQAGFEAALKMNSQKEMSDDQDSTQQNLRRPSGMVSKSSGMGQEQSNVEEKHENVRFPPGVLVANRGSGQTYSIDAYTDDAIVKVEKGSKAGEHVMLGAVDSRNIPAKRLGSGYPIVDTSFRQHGPDFIDKPVSMVDNGNISPYDARNFASSGRPGTSSNGNSHSREESGFGSGISSPGEDSDHSMSAVAISVKGGSFDGYGIGYVRNANSGTASSSQGHTLRQRPAPQSMYAGGEVPSSSIENIPSTRNSVAIRKVGFSGDDSLSGNSDRDGLKAFGSAVGYAEGEKVAFGSAVNDKRKQTGITVENGSFAGHASAGAK